jgi:hypothetical protein
MPGHPSGASSGFIVLARDTYKNSTTWAALNPVQKVIMITLLLMANHQDQEWWNGKETITIKRGQLITSLDSVKKACGKGVSTQNIRTAFVNLQKLGFLTYESTSQYRLVALVNYDFYQTLKNYQQSNRQSPNKALTTNKNVKNDQLKDHIYVDFVSWFNEQFGTKCRAGTYRDKINTRLETKTVEDLKAACLAMKRSPHMMGENDSHHVYATLEYITRSDKNVDKWLAQAEAAPTSPEHREMIR